MDSCPEPLEKIFQKVEAESEQRALQEQATAEQDEVAGNAGDHETSQHLLPTDRRRGSISISRFGELSCGQLGSNSGPPTPSRLSMIQSPFYQPSANMGSFSSAHLGEEANTEDEHQVTQMQQIAGRQSLSRAVGNLLPRRLTRARSATVVSPLDPTMVIGVSVEEATVEAQEDDHEEPTRTFAYAHGGPRSSKASKYSSASTTPSGSGWVDKAKELTKKFRRKGVPTSTSKDTTT